MGELDGKFAVITGAGSGMGRATSRIFVREGARVLGVDITGREKETAEELGPDFVPFSADVRRESDVEGIFREAVEVFGRVDAALNVAGVGSNMPLADVTLEGGMTIAGIIVDEKGKGVAGLQVRIGEGAVTTDASGRRSPKPRAYFAMSR